MMSGKIAVWVSVGVFVFSGCSSMAINAGFDDVKAVVEQRGAVNIFWNNGTELDKEAEDKLRSLMKDTVTVDQAVQIALLNNRDLQALYSELGVAQADLVQAGLLKNPIFDAAVLFPVSGGGRPDIEISAVMNFLDIFYLPLRKQVAASRFEEVKSRLAGSVLEFTGRVRSTFYFYEADEQMLELRQTVVQALSASFEVARRLYSVGNITDLDFARERALLESGKLALRSAEIQARQRREQLNILMGLWGAQTDWHSRRRLPEIPDEPMQTVDVEQLALKQSLDLSAARHRIETAGRQLGFSRWTALLPEIDAGPSIERREGSWEVGPRLEFPLPLFDQGQGQIGRAAAELRRSQQDYYAVAVRVRSTARAVRDRLEGARDRALYYRDILLPLHERIVNETQLQYNAMQLGPLQLLRAREQQIETAVRYVETLREYWIARADLVQISSGRLPSSMTAAISGASGPTNMRDGNGH
jgi:cobalt-zinc-cadmium efflux system outer membrane protein